MRNISLSLLLLFPITLQAADWSRDMADGSVVRYDPNTRTATHFSRGGTAKLWDGVHEASDGTVIIVRDGVVVTGGDTPAEPPEAGPAPQEGMGMGGTPPPQPFSNAATDSSCIDLVVKVCGFDGECSAAPGCSPARQLLGLQTEEAMRTGGASIAEVAGQCKEGMANETLFPTCNKAKAPAKPSACRQLSEKVCGAQNQCSDSPACAPSRQLVEMEHQERGAQVRRPERQVKLSKQCEKLMEGDAFFVPCAK